jgi:hypothetical protein
MDPRDIRAWLRDPETNGGDLWLKANGEEAIRLLLGRLDAFEDRDETIARDSAERRARMDAFIAKLEENAPPPPTPEEMEKTAESFAEMFKPCEHCGKSGMSCIEDESCHCCYGCIRLRDILHAVLTNPKSETLAAARAAYEESDPRQWIGSEIAYRLKDLGVEVVRSPFPDFIQGSKGDKTFAARADGIKVFYWINHGEEKQAEYLVDLIDTLVAEFQTPLDGSAPPP